MNKFSESFAKVFRFIVIILGTLLIVAGIIMNEYDKYQIKKYGKYAIAIVTKVDDRKGWPVIFYEYNIRGKEYRYAKSCNYCSLKIGDTILIKYSVNEEDISRVISFDKKSSIKIIDSLERAE
jgi:hypothetical protein